MRRLPLPRNHLHGANQRRRGSKSRAVGRGPQPHRPAPPNLLDVRFAILLAGGAQKGADIAVGPRSPDFDRLARREGRARRSGSAAAGAGPRGRPSGGRSPGPVVCALGRAPRFRPRRPARNRGPKPHVSRPGRRRPSGAAAQGRHCRPAVGGPLHCRCCKQRQRCNVSKCLFRASSDPVACAIVSKGLPA
jgi:hypothetical protein